MQKDQYLTVSALTSYLKQKFDVDPYLQRVYLVGEISNFRLRPNNHQYFSLKDDNSKISAIMFKSAFAKVKFQPEEGMKVLVSGRIGLYPGNGSYQIYIDSMQPDGVGALYKAYEQLKAKLAKEGLFDAPKAKIPLYPKKIAIVTSPSGAVIRDIITTVKRRYPIAQLVLFPAVVQGNEAAHSIAEQIKKVNTFSDFDTLIIGRGGGSIEDLWPFNEEEVARAIFDSKVPIISSVGHETDTTIADLVADVRAATPTAAAELATPVLNDLLEGLQKIQLRIQMAFKNHLQLKEQQVEHLKKSYILQDPQRLYEGYIQNVDLLSQKMYKTMQSQVSNERNELNKLLNDLQRRNPKLTVVRNQQIVESLKQDILAKSKKRLNDATNSVSQIIGKLDGLSPLKVMGRGYTYVTSDSQVVKSVNSLKVNDDINLNFKDGIVAAKVQEIKKGES